MRKLLLTSIMIAISAGSALAQQQKTAPPPFTEIQGTVISVKQLTFPHVRLSIKVSKSSNPKILDLKRNPATALTVENYLWRTGEKVDFQDKRNITSIGAFYLLQGDEISAKLINGSTLAPGGYIFGISRVMGVKPQLQMIESIKTYGDLQLSLKSDSAVYPFGVPIPIIFSVKNIGNKSRTLRFENGQKFDFVITRSGKEVWTWSDGKLFDDFYYERTLGPGEVLTFKQSWFQQDSDGRQMAAGEYKITSMLTEKGIMEPTVGPISVKIVSKP